MPKDSKETKVMLTIECKNGHISPYQPRDPNKIPERIKCPHSVGGRVCGASCKVSNEVVDAVPAELPKEVEKPVEKKEPYYKSESPRNTSNCISTQKQILSMTKSQTFHRHSVDRHSSI